MAIIYDSVIVDILLLSIAGTVAFYLYFTRNFNYWKKRGVVFSNPTPLFGNLKDLFLQRDSMGDFLMKEYEKHSGQPYFGLFSVDKPAFVVRDLDVTRNILVKDFEVFQDRSISVDEQTDPLNAKGIIVQKGKKWRYIRMKLTPTFSSNKIKNMFCLVDAKAAELAEFVEQQSLRGNTISVKEISSGYTIDVLASCAFGVNANAINDGNGEFPKILRKIFEMKTIAIIKQTLVVFLPWLANFLKLKVSGNDVDDFVRKTLWDVVGHREKNGIKRQDFVDLLMQLRKGEPFLEQTINDGTKVADQQERRSITNKNDVLNIKLDDDDYAAQAHSFLIAGFHTSANTTSFALYELATQPDMQTRLRQEILDVLDKHGGKITHDALTEMTYLDMVVSGMRFGLITVKTGLVHLLSKFEVRPCQQTLIPLVLDKTAAMLTTSDTLPLAFSLINS
uniref:Cytochrome P450 n=1 Tax=Timema monikensis TaxID=170555 RepID=A0A7R9E5E4_9NEOP|nr:unnamed protein product [Timema monikensis]